MKNKLNSSSRSIFHHWLLRSAPCIAFSPIGLSTVAFLLVVLVMGFSPLLAQNCAYYGNDAPDPFLDSLYIPSTANRVVYNNQHIFVYGYNTLTSVNVSNPNSLSIDSSISSNCWINDFSLNGNYAYVVGDTTRFNIFNISNPESMTLVGEAQTSSDGRAVVGYQNYAYISLSDLSIEVFNISNPASPISIATIPVVNYGYDLAVNDHYLFVAESTGLEVFDIIVPASPVHVDSLSTAPGYCIATAGQYAYVASQSGGLRVVDISNPAQMSVVGQVATPFSPSHITVNNNRAYLTRYNNGVQVVDISNPAHPSLLYNYSTPGNSFDIAVVNNVLIVADGSSGIQTIDLSIPAFSDAWISGGLGSLANKVDVEGSFAYVISQVSLSDALNIFDITNPSLPVARGSLITSLDDRDIDVHNGYAYIANGYGGIAVFNIADPDHPFVSNHINISDYCLSVAVSGNVAFVGSGGGSSGVLSLYDVTNPSSIMPLGSVITPDSVEDIVINGQYAYLAADDDGMITVDISDSDNPIVLDQISTTTSEAMGIATEGNYAYVADEQLGLLIIDITNPADLHQVGILYIAQRYQERVAVFNGYAYVTLCGEGFSPNFAVVDVNNPYYPELITEYSSSAPCHGIHTDGRYLYIAEYSDGLNIYNLQCGSATAVNEHHEPSSSITINGNYPNPFNPKTCIQYYLTNSMNVRLEIFALDGSKVNTLYEGIRAQGTHFMYWNGLDSSGKQVPSGVYFYRVAGGGQSETRKMMLLR